MTSRMNFRISWGYCNAKTAHVEKFETALEVARAVLKTQTFEGNGRQPPTIANTLNEDEGSDGLSAEQRDRAREIGLEVTGG